MQVQRARVHARGLPPTRHDGSKAQIVIHIHQRYIHATPRRLCESSAAPVSAACVRGVRPYAWRAALDAVRVQPSHPCSVCRALAIASLASARRWLLHLALALSGGLLQAEMETIRRRRRAEAAEDGLAVGGGGPEESQHKNKNYDGSEEEEEEGEEEEALLRRFGEFPDAGRDSALQRGTNQTENRGSELSNPA